MNATHKKLFIKKTNVRIKTIKRMLMRFSLNALGLLFPHRARLLIKQWYFRPTRRRTTAKEQEWLDRATNFQVRVHDKTIQCWKWGDGPPILAVHGWNGRGINLHPLFAPLLQQGFAVVTFDAPAHGVSDGTHTNYFEMTDTVRAMVNAMGKRSVVGIVAHSLGGSAVINCLSKEGMNLKTVLIAPALRLRELLYNTFNNQGVPATIYKSIIREIESDLTEFSFDSSFWRNMPDGNYVWTIVASLSQGYYSDFINRTFEKYPLPLIDQSIYKNTGRYIFSP